MRKRNQNSKRSLSSAQATGDNMSQKNNVAEQGEELMNAISDLLHGKRIDEVISVGMSITLDGIRQKSHGNPIIATLLFKHAAEAMSEAFFNLTLKQCVDE